MSPALSCVVFLLYFPEIMLIGRNHLSLSLSLFCGHTIFSGKSNIVSGVVQTIKAHFEKHPLAVVNVKGRAKGTSVQELVFKLEVHMQKIPSICLISSSLNLSCSWAINTPYILIFLFPVILAARNRCPSSLSGA